jgi:hypothetical protein
VSPGYRRHERIEEHPLLGDGIRSRVGVVNIPLPALLNAVTGAGLLLQETAEDDSDQPIPSLFGIMATRPSDLSSAGRRAPRCPRERQSSAASGNVRPVVIEDMPVGSLASVIASDCGGRLHPASCRPWRSRYAVSAVSNEIPST